MKLFHADKDTTGNKRLSTNTEVNNANSFKTPKMPIKSFIKSSQNVIQPFQNELIKQKFSNQPTNDNRGECHLNASKRMIQQKQQKPQLPLKQPKQLKQKEQQTKSEFIKSSQCNLLFQQKNEYDREENLNKPSTSSQIKRKKFNENLNKFNFKLGNQKSTGHNVTFNKNVEFFEDTTNEIIEGKFNSNNYV